MLVKTKAIVLTSVKYGDSDLIVKCLTQNGIKSYLLRKIYSARGKKLKTAYFQPLNQLELSAIHNKKNHLNSIREVQLSLLYLSLSTNVYKQSIAFFLAELLAGVLREEEENLVLFEFVESSLVWLDENDNYADFHLLFLLKLTRHLGFYPETSENQAVYFDLQEGMFTNIKPFGHFIDGVDIDLFKSIIGINFDDMISLKWNSNNRRRVLDLMMIYYECHLPGFRKPKSLKVLKEVFNEIS